MSSRRANGEGSIRQRKDGRWEGRYTSPDGRQRSVFGRTKTACREALQRALAQVRTGTWVEPSRLTVGQWLQTWLADYCGHLKPTSLRNYQWYVRVYFTPAIGQIPLAKLKAVHIQQMFNTLARRLSPNTIKTIRIALSSALGCAVRFELLQANPVEKTTVPRPEPVQMSIVDRQLFAAFTAAARATAVGDALILLLQTGLRSGELRGLRWEDVDLDAARLTVNRQITYTGSTAVLQTPKSGKARTIVLMDDAVELLRRHRIRQNEARLAHGGWVDDELSSDLVFRRPNGRPYTRTTMIGPCARVGQAIGLPELHPHDLRHSYAVAALRSGIDVKTVQNNLGHASAAMTLDTYAAYTDDMGRTAAQKLQTYWRDQAN